MIVLDTHISIQMKNVITKFWRQPALAMCLGAGLTCIAPTQAAVLKTEANVMVELTFKAARPYPTSLGRLSYAAVSTDQTVEVETSLGFAFFTS